VIFFKVKGNYFAKSNSGGEILHIKKVSDGINAITKEKDRSVVDVKILEVYA